MVRLGTTIFYPARTRTALAALAGYILVRGLTAFAGGQQTLYNSSARIGHTGAMPMPRPNSLPWMESVDAKIRRANEHLFTFTEEVSKWLRDTKHNFVVKHDPKTGNQWLVCWANYEIPPIYLSAILGDIGFNLRAALDHLACGPVRTPQPASSAAGRQFPTYTKRK